MVKPTGRLRSKNRVSKVTARRAQLMLETLESRQLMAYDTTVLADGPVAYYRFENATANVALNQGSAGAAANGAVLGGISVVPGATAALGNAYSFNGSTGRVQLPDVAAFNMGTGAATYEMWFSTTQGARGDMLTYKNTGAGGDFGIQWYSNGKTNSVDAYHNGFTVGSANNGVGTGQWHHIVVTRSSTDINGTVLYLDGRAIAKGQDGQTFDIANDILIGANHNNNPSTGAGTFFNGLIDEVAIYNTSLTEEQVQTHYDAGLGNYTGAVTENRAVLHYNFNDPVGSSIVQDATVNDRDGAVTGGVTFGLSSALNQPVITASRTGGAFAVSGSDLLNGLSAVASGSAFFTANGESNNVATLTNGQFGAGGVIGGTETISIQNNTTLTYQLNTVANPLGYRINSINTFSGWQDAGRTDQNYRVEFATVDNPGVFAPLATVGVGAGSNSLQVSITAPSGMLATRVGQIRFVFPGQQNGYVGYRELDVIGVPVAPSEAINLGTAADFNGSSYITGPTASQLGMTNASWTATAWIRPESNSGDLTIFGNENGGNNIGLHLITRGGNLHMGFFANDLATGSAPPLNQWSHVAFSFDAATGRRVVYLNGAPIATDVTGTPYQGTGAILIGRWGGGNHFDGQIDEASIFPSALSPAEITAMYRTTMQPHANNDSFTVGETGSISGSLIANDTGPRQLASPGPITTGAGSSVAVNFDGTFSYAAPASTNTLAQGQSVVDSFIYSLANVGINLPTANLRFGNFGPGGTVNAYLHLPVNLSWDDARAYAAGLSFAGVSGHLVTVGSAAENIFLRANFTGNYWLGLSDSTGYAPDGVKNSQVDSANVHTSPAWAWTNAEPYTYQNWAFPGEPNGGTGENVGEFRGDGLWNDLSTQTIPAVIEFNLGQAGTTTAGFAFRQVQSTNGLATDNASAEALLATSVVSGTVNAFRYGVYPTLNFVGAGDGGRYGDNVAYPIAGDQSNFAVEATGSIFIPAAGSYTFGVSSDDGFTLNITGATLTSQIVNGGASTQGVNGTLSFSGGRGSAAPGGETLGVFTFPAPGFYPLRVISYEGGGGDSLELYAAPGALNAFDASAFDLVGNSANGGLVVLTNTPSLTSETARATVTIVGENDAPVVGTVAAQTINDGQSVTFTMVGASDVDNGAVLSYEWDINGDGTYDVTTSVPTVTRDQAQLEALSIDGPFSTNTVRARVRDEFNALSAVATTSLTVNNLNPVGSISGPSAVGRTRSAPFVFSATDTQFDQAAGLTVAVNWGDSSTQTFTNVTAGSVNSPHTYAADGTYTVTLTVTDRNGATDVKTSTIFVGGPTLSFNPAVVSSGSENSPAATNTVIPLGIVANNTDPEPGIFTVTIAGIPANARITNAAGSSAGLPAIVGGTIVLTQAQANAAHLVKDDNQPNGSPIGNFSLTVTATSTPTNVAVAPISAPVGTRSITVANALPEPDISGPSTLGRGVPTEFTFSAADSVGDEAANFTYVINWGEGPAQTFTNVPAAGLTLTRTYANEGSRMITLTVTDHDNQSKTVTLPIVISAVFVDDLGNLIVGGSGNADRIVLSNGPGGIVATINNKRYPGMSPDSSLGEGRILVYGGAQNDTITVASTVGYPVEIYGGPGNDYIAGSAQADILHGEDGTDRILGGGGDDFIYGGNGNDTISGGAGNDTAYGDAYFDADGVQQDGTGNDTIGGDVGDDTLYGGAGNDKVNGGSGADVIFGGLGGDTLKGDAGDDLILGDAGADFMYGLDGNDVLIGGGAGDTLYGGNGDDALFGDGLTESDAMAMYADWLLNGSAGIGSSPLADYPGLVEADNAPDSLYGQGGNDWLLLFLSATNVNDRVREGRASEIEQH